MIHLTYLTLLSLLAIVSLFAIRRCSKIAWEYGYKTGERQGRRPSVEALSNSRLMLATAEARIIQLEEQISCLIKEINNTQREFSLGGMP